MLYVIKWLKNQNRKPAFVNGLSCFSCLRGKQVLPVNPLMAFSVHSFLFFETEEDREDWLISHIGKICFEVQFFKRFFKIYIPSINKKKLFVTSKRLILSLSLLKPLWTFYSKDFVKIHFWQTLFINDWLENFLPSRSQSTFFVL